MRLHFLGANRQVTGSRYLLEAGRRKIMIDCGLFQERCCLERNWAPSPVPPDEVDVLLLTHAHLDHCGLIPKLVAEGFTRDILTTAPSADLARIVLDDAAHIQEEDAEYKKRRHEREGRRGPHPEVPLYTEAEAEAAVARLRIVQYDKPVDLAAGVRVWYRDAGHILGAAILEVEVSAGGPARRIVFSGDLGQSGVPLTRDPAAIERADLLVMESTYGDRNHERERDVLEHLADAVNGTVERGGNLVIPTFAIDRAQDLLYLLGELVRQERIPRVTVFVDSPMAIDATTIYKRYKFLFNDQAQALLAHGEHPFQFPGLHFVRSSGESRAINSIRGSCIILAGSGMCTGGRIKHHLRQNLGRPESTVLFTGWQARDTLGRQILERAPEVRIHGGTYQIRARVEHLNGLSAHADQRGLLAWLGRFKTPPPRICLTHGEPQAADALRGKITAAFPSNVEIPDYLDSVEL